MEEHLFLFDFYSLCIKSGKGLIFEEQTWFIIYGSFLYERSLLD